MPCSGVPAFITGRLVLAVQCCAQLTPAGFGVAEAVYDVDPKRADVFYEAVRKYWPGTINDFDMPPSSLLSIFLLSLSFLRPRPLM